MIRKSQPRTGREAASGQVIILFALSSLVLVGMLALAIDVGYMLAERRQTQAAADAGVMAAAHASLQNLTANQVEAAGEYYGAINADVDEGDVKVNQPPVSGEYAGDDGYIQVTITKDVQRFFLGAVYDGDWQVSASAVALVQNEGLNAALLALDPDDGDINATGNAQITVEDGSIVSNYNIDATGNIFMSADEYIAANDGFDPTGNVTLEGGLGENESAAEVPDPLTGKISPPDLPPAPSSADNYYSGGSEMAVTGNEDVTLDPGTYVFDGGRVSS